MSSSIREGAIYAVVRAIAAGQGRTLPARCVDDRRKWSNLQCLNPEHVDGSPSAYCDGARNIFGCSVCGVQTAKQLAEAHGLPWPGILGNGQAPGPGPAHGHGPVPVPVPAPAPEVEPSIPHLQQLWEDLARVDQVSTPRTILDYLASRGLLESAVAQSPDTIRCVPKSSMPRSRADRYRALKDRAESLTGTSALTPAEIAEFDRLAVDYYASRDPWLAFALRTPAGAMIGIQLRRASADGPKQGRMRTIGLSSWGMFGRVDQIEAASKVLVCEGPTNMLAAMGAAAGLSPEDAAATAIVGIAGVENYAPLCRAALAGKVVYLDLDPDKAGDTAEPKIAEAILTAADQAGAQIPALFRVRVPPQNGDLAEHLGLLIKASGRADLGRLMEQARPAISLSGRATAPLAPGHSPALDPDAPVPDPAAQFMAAPGLSLSLLSGPPPRPRQLAELIQGVQSGRFESNFAQAIRILEEDSEYAGRLYYDERWMMPRLGKELISDEDIGEIRNDTAKAYARWELNFGKGDMTEAVKTVAKRQSVDLVQMYLDSLTWDGVSRLDGTSAWTGRGDVLTDVLRVETGDIPLYREMLRAWFVSAVKRAYKPGCKADCALVLFGAQGKRKSTFFRVLGELPTGSFYSESQIDIGGKDAQMVCSRQWIIELAEIENVTTRKEAGAVKNFLSTLADVFRRPYGSSIGSYGRRCVFGGSTNKKEFLVDETGSRRFYVIDAPNTINTELLLQIRDQLWAEAVAKYQAGEQPWLQDAFTERLSDSNERYQSVQNMTLTEQVLSLVEGREKYRTGPFMMAELVEDLGLNQDQSARHEKAIGACLRNEGYEKEKGVYTGTSADHKGKRRYWWTKRTPAAAPPPPVAPPAPAPVQAKTPAKDLGLPLPVAGKVEIHIDKAGQVSTVTPPPPPPEIEAPSSEIEVFEYADPGDDF